MNRSILAAVPRQDTKWFQVGSILVLISAALSFCFHFIGRGMSSFAAMQGVFSVLFLAGAILLLLAGHKTVPLWVAALLLTLGSLNGLLGLAQLFFLLSCIGFSWNKSLPGLQRITRSPLLTIVAIILLVLSGFVWLCNLLIWLIPNPVNFLRIIWRNCLPNVLMYAGLLLTFLCLEPQERERKWTVAKGTSAPELKTVSDAGRSFFNRVGNKIMVLAKVLAVIELVVALIGVLIVVYGFIFALINETFVVMGIGFGVIVVAVLGAIMTWFVFAFGQITSDVHELRMNGAISGHGGVCAEHEAAAPADVSPESANTNNPDELPEL